MKITAINVENVLGVRQAQIQINTAVTMICGNNHAGKSSLYDAIGMALLGAERVRGIALKKDYPALVNDTAKNGYAQVVMGDASSTFGLPKGTASAEGGYVPSPALPFLLDAQRFASMDDKARRTFLFGLMGLKMDLESVTKRMLDKGLDKAKVGRVMPLLRTGFESACTDAKAKATEAKGAWKAVTGETYGSVKAKTWAAEKPEVDANALQLAKQKVDSVDQQLADANQNLGALKSNAQAFRARAERITALEESAGRLDRLTAKLANEEADLAAWETKVVDAEARASGAAPVEPLTCPHCAGLVDLNKGALLVHVPPTAVRDAEAAAALPQYRASRDLLASAVANTKRDITAAQGAAAELKSLSEGDQLVQPSQSALEEAQALIADLTNRRAAAATALRAAQTNVDAAASADKKTELAMVHHTDVEQWDAIGDALAPDGVPSEILAEALMPINERLLQSSKDAEWPVVVLDKDMAITSGGRLYNLLSESEKWRADAMLAEAISHQSKLKLLVLDRFDVLDQQGRSDLLAWLEVLATNGEIDTCLLFGTLKSLPANLPPGVSAEWIHNGSVGEVKAAA